MASTADILVENYLPGTLSKYGLGYKQLSKINPMLIYASITGYGQTGPYRDRAGYDVMVEAYAILHFLSSLTSLTTDECREMGLMHITGEPDRPPVKVGVAVTGKL